MAKVDLSTFFTNSNEMLCVASMEGYFVELNPTWSQVLGYSIEELKSRPFVEFVHPDDLESTAKESQKLAEGDEVIRFSNRYKHKDGHWVWLGWTASVNGEYIFAVASNISHIKEQNYFFEQMQETAKIGYWKLNLETMTPYWSDKTYDIHGVPRGQEVDLANAINFYAPEARPVVEQMVQKSIETGVGWDEELPFINAQGENLWVRTVGEARKENGKVVELHGIFQDVTERKSTDLILEQSLKEVKKYKKALDQQALVSATDTNGIITYVNEKFCEVSGYSQFELMGEDHRVLNSGHHPKEFFQDLWTTVLSGRQWKGKVKNKTKSGDYYWVDSTVTPIVNRNGEVEELISIRTDITERVRLEEQIKTQEANLVRSSRLASLGEMAGGVAHEINNPLAIINTATMILKSSLQGDNVSPEALQPSIETIEKTVKRISDIVAGLRSFAREEKADSKKIVQLKEIVEETLTFCRQRFKSRGVELKVTVPEDIDLEVNSTQISQVLLNLLNNAFYAVKNSEEKLVELVVVQKENCVHVKVSDNGVGIPEDIREKVFQPFFTTKPVGSGTGLGLGISYGIAQSHDGTLFLDDDRSKTTFVLKLPLKQSKATHREDKKQAA